MTAVGVLPVVGESTPDDLEVLRGLFDLSLQPLDQFDGFDRRDQVGTAAYRYQLNFIGYALALSQLTRTPAFTGYLAAAQRNLIVKMCDKRVWGYWARESRIGYLRHETDPIRHANVMYSGYLGVMIGVFQTLNQDDAFDRPGSLTYRWDDQISHEYDFRRLAFAIRENMLAKPKCPQYPCEPHLIYPICNTFALNTLMMYDRLHNDDISSELVSKVRTSYDADGWRRADRRFIPIRLGASVNLSPPVIGSDAAMALWLSAAMPDIARQTWDMITSRLLRWDGDDVVMRGRSWLRIDVGNYRFTNGEANTKVAVMNAAREFGADHIADRLSEAIDSDLEQERARGARRYRGVSNLVNAMYALARFSRTNGVADLIAGRIPEQWRTGPVLAEAAYPDVLVARALTDGSDLDLVLYPGTGPHRARLGIARLQPNRTHRVGGAVEPTVTADERGLGYVDVDLDARTAVSLAPTQ
ncbi:hypothetical protein JDV09_23900 [Mycobacterium sp. Y57]|uniref:linalool dehydratase/isomerase domain-containing protein n=1 Tax=Mycolicibacterium xanthum TaxID=2796469 RepID=UPI001C857122|nr:hypothetical protein [Mycolicibacterium xanthum]MBX7435118.1 hypothetical protein [Mycolicibacterium xanthum]